MMRHGESVWNIERRWAGSADPDLSLRGKQEACEACESLKALGFKCVTSSPLKRARSTALIISNALGIPMEDPVPELSERHAGAISGLTSPEIEARFPGLLDRWRACGTIEIPGGEPWGLFVTRVEKGILTLARIGESPVLVVVHEGVLRAINDLVNEPQRKNSNLEGRWLTLDDDRIGAYQDPGRTG